MIPPFHSKPHGAIGRGNPSNCSPNRVHVFGCFPSAQYDPIDRSAVPIIPDSRANQTKLNGVQIENSDPHYQSPNRVKSELPIRRQNKQHCDPAELNSNLRERPQSRPSVPLGDSLAKPGLFLWTDKSREPFLFLAPSRTPPTSQPVNPV